MAAGDVINAEQKFKARRAAADKARGKPSGDTVLTGQQLYEQRIEALKKKLEDSRKKDT